MKALETNYSLKDRIRKLIETLTATTILFVITLSLTIAKADNKLSANDLTEGGHLETDSGAYFLAEWWYLNGTLELEAGDGENDTVASALFQSTSESKDEAPTREAGGPGEIQTPDLPNPIRRWPASNPLE